MNRNGLVLLLALLCIVALEVVAAGLYFITMQEISTEQSARRDLELRLAARSAVARTLASWPADAIRDLPLHASVTVPMSGASNAGAVGGESNAADAADGAAAGITSIASIARVGDRLYLVCGTAQSRLRESAGIGALVETVSTEDLMADVRSAVQADAPVTTRGTSTIVGGIELRDTLRAGSGIATLSMSRLITLAQTASTYAANESAAYAGAGSSAAHGGAGSSAAYGTEGSSAAPLKYADSRFTGPLDGAGVLVIDGPAEIRGGHFSGVIISRGSLTLMDGAHVDGGVLVRSGGLLVDNSSITLDTAAVRAALANTLLRGPYRRRGRMWIPIFQAC